ADCLRIGGGVVGALRPPARSGCKRDQKTPDILCRFEAHPGDVTIGTPSGGRAETIRAAESCIDRVRADLPRRTTRLTASPQRLGRSRWCAIVWLLALAIAALGAADALSAPRLKHSPTDRSKAVEADRQKHGSVPIAKRGGAVRQKTRVTHPAVIPLP